MFKEKDIELVRESFQEIEGNQSVFIKTFYSRLYDLDTDKSEYLQGELVQKRNEIITVLKRGIEQLENVESLNADLKEFGTILKEYGVPVSTFSTAGVAFIDALAAVLQYHKLSQEITMAWSRILKYFFKVMGEV